MGTSVRKREANRANARLSTGPTSAEGKAVSRRNALKHGMAANVLAMPDEDQNVLDAKREAWVGGIAGENAAAAEFADRAFRALVRAQRVDRAQDAALASRVRRAEQVWEVARAEEVDQALSELSTRPIVALARLKSTAEGVRVLIKMWEPLKSGLEVGRWSWDHHGQALRLLGEDRNGNAPLQLATQIIIQTRDDLRTFGVAHSYVDLTNGEETSHRIGRNEPMSVMRMAKEGREAHDRLAELIDREMNTLRALEQKLAPLSTADKAEAPTACLLDDSEKGQLLNRYLNAAERDLHRNYKAALAEAAVETVAEAESAPAADSPKSAPEQEKSPAPNEPNAKAEPRSEKPSAVVPVSTPTHMNRPKPVEPLPRQAV